MKNKGQEMKNNFGLEFRKQREARNLTQKDLSKFLGYSSLQFISNVERGICYFPQSVLKKICNKYKIDYGPLAELVISEKIAKLRRDWAA